METRKLCGSVHIRIICSSCVCLLLIGSWNRKFHSYVPFNIYYEIILTVHSIPFCILVMHELIFFKCWYASSLSWPFWAYLEVLQFYWLLWKIWSWRSNFPPQHGIYIHSFGSIFLKYVVLLGYSVEEFSFELAQLFCWFCCSWQIFVLIELDKAIQWWWYSCYIFTFQYQISFLFTGNHVTEDMLARA